MDNTFQVDLIKSKTFKNNIDVVAKKTIELSKRTKTTLDLLIKDKDRALVKKRVRSVLLNDICIEWEKIKTQIDSLRSEIVGVWDYSLEDNDLANEWDSEKEKKEIEIVAKIIEKEVKNII